MENSNFQINDIHELDEAVRRLRALSRRYQDFFQLQFQRLEAHMKMQQQMLDRADAVRSMLDDIQSQKENWESQRQSEMQQIDAASQKLAGAWQALEQQQRQLLVDRATPPTTNVLPPPNSGMAPPTNQRPDPQPSPTFAANPEHSRIPLTGFGTNGQQVDFAVAAQVQQGGQPPTANPLPPFQHGQLAAMPPQQANQPTQPNEMGRPEISEPADPEAAKFEYEQLKRQMREHANRQG